MTWTQWEVEKYPDNGRDFPLTFARETSYRVVLDDFLVHDEIPQDYTASTCYIISYTSAGYIKTVRVYIFHTERIVKNRAVVNYYVGTPCYNEIKEQNIIHNVIYYCGGVVDPVMNAKVTYRVIDTKSVFKVKHFPGDEDNYNLLFTTEHNSSFPSIFEKQESNSCLRSLISKWESEYFKLKCGVKYAASTWFFSFFYRRIGRDASILPCGPIVLKVPIDGSNNLSLSFKDKEDDIYFNEFRADIIAMCGGLYAPITHYKRNVVRKSNMKSAGKIYRKRVTYPLGSEDRDIPDDEEVINSVTYKSPMLSASVNELRGEVDKFNDILQRKEEEIVELRRVIGEMSSLFK